MKGRKSNSQKCRVLQGLALALQNKLTSLLFVLPFEIRGFQIWLGKKKERNLTCCWAQGPSAVRGQPYFLISLTVTLADVFAGQSRAAAVCALVEAEERLLLLENPEDLPSNEMLSRSSELSCQKKAAQWRKARQPAQSERQIATPTPHTLITFWEALRQITVGGCLLHTNRNLLLLLNQLLYLLRTVMPTADNCN